MTTHKVLREGKRKALQKPRDTATLAASYVFPIGYSEMLAHTFIHRLVTIDQRRESYGV
jgi:hypothetical protein